jgi:hypothetical protein
MRAPMRVQTQAGDDGRRRPYRPEQFQGRIGAIPDDDHTPHAARGATAARAGSVGVPTG